MQRSFKKIIEEIEELKNKNPFIYGKNDKCRDAAVSRQTLDYAVEKVNQVASEYGGGWIPVSSGKLPEGGVTVIVSYKDRFLPQADGTCDGWYDEPNRMWHLSDYEHSDNVEVTAWRERLEPYKAESEE